MRNNQRQFPTTRLRRLRYNKAIRELVSETRLHIADFIYPLFVRHGKGDNPAISSMPGQYQIYLDNLTKEIDELVKLNIPAILLFGIPDYTDVNGSDAYSDDGIVQQAIRIVKQHAPELIVISDLCCCEYTDTGHCGILKNNVIDNDATLTLLQKQTISHAQAGVDIVAPSGMIDGAVGAIRTALDEHGFEQTPILSYAVKYASSFYGPFREAAGGSAPQHGDRKNHQMNIANGDEALLEAELDINEGADMLMVKPANMYLDVIYRVKQQFPGVPLAAYQVSGEYAMLHAAAERGMLNLEAAMLESLLALKRAGADLLISYFAKDIAKLQLN